MAGRQHCDQRLFEQLLYIELRGGNRQPDEAEIELVPQSWQHNACKPVFSDPLTLTLTITSDPPVTGELIMGFKAEASS